jgi:Tfp pilus assembly protein PilV
MRTRRDACGFSLVEALVAILILTIGVGALAQLFLLVVRANVAAREITESTVLAQQKIEQLIASGWWEPVNGADVLVVNGATYQRRWIIELLPSNPARSRAIQVVVTAAPNGRPVRLHLVKTQVGGG